MRRRFRESIQARFYPLQDEVVAAYLLDPSRLGGETGAIGLTEEEFNGGRNYILLNT